MKARGAAKNIGTATGALPPKFLSPLSLINGVWKNFLFLFAPPKLCHPMTTPPNGMDLHGYIYRQTHALSPEARAVHTQHVCVCLGGMAVSKGGGVPLLLRVTSHNDNDHDFTKLTALTITDSRHICNLHRDQSTRKIYIDL